MIGNCLIIFTLLLGGTIAQSETSVRDAISSLPAEVQGNLNETQLQDISNKTQMLFKDKCNKNGGPDAFAKSEKAAKDFQKCIQSLVNYEKLTQEMEAAKPNGTLDEVFKRYCAKSPQFKDCFSTMAETSKICLSDNEKSNMKIVYNVTEQLADFICYKEGDRITLFIAEQGPECFTEKQESIKQCFNTTFGRDIEINTNNITANYIPNIAFTTKECGQLSSLQSCMVKSLESCNAPTTANIVDSLFKFIRESTPCIKFDKSNRKSTQPTPKAAKANAASTATMTLATVLLATTSALLA